MERRWWGRIWVVQEVALARTAEVWCGGEKEGWELVSRVVGYVVQHEFRGFTVRREEVEGFTGSGGGWQMVGNLEGARVRIGRGVVMGFSVVLRSLYALQAGDARDKIYGVLGIVDDAAEMNVRANCGVSVEDCIQRLPRISCLRRSRWDCWLWRVLDGRRGLQDFCLRGLLTSRILVAIIGILELGPPQESRNSELASWKAKNCI